MPARRALSSLRAAAACSLALLGSSAAQAANFIGSASCRVCHEAAYEQWQASPHARALQSLPPDQQKDGRCLVCHARDLAAGGEPGISCETCHGAGQYYWPKYVMRDAEVAKGAGLVAAPDAKACVLCHDASNPSLKPFDPATAMPAIDHWSKDWAARAKKSAQNCPRPGAASAAVSLARGELRPDERILGRALTGRGIAAERARKNGTSSPVPSAKGLRADVSHADAVASTARAN